MADAQETTADIIAEMRKISAEKYRLSSENGGAYGNPGVYHLDFAQFARAISDRLEAAHRREREALEFIAHYDDNEDQMDDPYCADGHILAGKAKEVLGIKEETK